LGQVEGNGKTPGLGPFIFVGDREGDTEEGIRCGGPGSLLRLLEKLKKQERATGQKIKCF